MHMKKIYYLGIALLCIGSESALSQIPTGYYVAADGLSKAELKTALHQIVSKAQMLGYGSGSGKTWAGFFETDQLENGVVFDRYSNTIRYFDGFKAVEGMNIEHSFPKSWWKGYENNAYRDLFHLYPSDGQTNTIKGNLPLGEIYQNASFDNGVSKIGPNGFSNVYTGSCFEPADEYKGDFARSYFYIVTAYENFKDWWTSPMLDNNTWPVFNKWSTELLLKWHREDPVSPIEQNRQEKVYQIQGNRNPYIDYPELVEYIWGKDTLLTYQFPTESTPVLSKPTSWDKLDMGVEMVNTTIEKTLAFKGVNFSSDLYLSLKQNDGRFSISTESLTAAAVNEGTDITVRFSSDTPGYSYDTLVISSTDLPSNRLIPLSALTAVDFMTMEPSAITATTAQLNWISAINATGYKIDIYQGDKVAGDIIISKYIEGSSNNKAIELYNGTGKEIDLSRYSLKRQTNGNGSFSSELKLKGVLPNNSCWLICLDAATDALKNLADTLVGANVGASAIAFNGNDAVALYHDGIMIDVVGEVNNPAMWGQDCSLYRETSVTHPTTSFDWNEWDKKSIDTFTGVGSHNMTLSADPKYIENGLMVGNQAYYSYQGLTPEQKYTYKVTAILEDGSTIETINTSQIKTNPLQSPEVLDATEITATGFHAHWESVAEATHYLFDLFTLSGAGEQYIEEGFNNVGSNGTPLPEGWSGTASGNYSSAASSGKSPNSIALKQTGEWLQTPTYSDGINKFTFMYRFPSSVTGAFFTIDGYLNEQWVNIDTIYSLNNTKNTLEYKVSQPFTNLRFTYANKVSGTNLALDDIGIWHGAADTIFIARNQEVTEPEYLISGLQPETTYYYQIKAGTPGYQSLPSDVRSITTLAASALNNNSASEIKYHSTDAGIAIWNLQVGTSIRIFDINGKIVYQTVAQDDAIIVPHTKSGVYLLQCITTDFNKTIRIIR